MGVGTSGCLCVRAGVHVPPGSLNGGRRRNVKGAQGARIIDSGWGGRERSGEKGTFHLLCVQPCSSWGLGEGWGAGCIHPLRESPYRL